MCTHTQMHVWCVFYNLQWEWNNTDPQRQSMVLVWKRTPQCFILGGSQCICFCCAVVLGATVVVVTTEYVCLPANGKAVLTFRVLPVMSVYNASEISVNSFRFLEVHTFLTTTVFNPSPNYSSLKRLVFNLCLHLLGLNRASCLDALKKWLCYYWYQKIYE